MRKFLLKYWFWLSPVIVLIVYLFTLAPSVIQIDSGELATVETIGGIAHPTGYPLFTIIGYLFLHLPLPFSKIYSANLLSALYCVAAVLVFTSSVRLILKNISLVIPPENKKIKKDAKDYSIEIDVWTIIITTIAGSLFLALGRTFWFQSTSVEVYSLHTLLLNATIFVLLKILFINNTGKTSTVIWLVLSIVLALSFSNHMTTILIIPGVAYIYFLVEGVSKKSFYLLLKMIVLFFIILTALYSYLPIRASFNLALNWGNPETLENLFRHVKGAQYSTWIFSSFESAKEQFVYFLTTLPDEFTYPGLLIIFSGIIFTVRFQRKLFYFFAATALTTIAYSINYDIVDIDSYFLLAYISFAFFASFGFLSIILFLRKKVSRVPLSLLIFIPVLYLAWQNIQTTDQSDKYIFQDYTTGILNSVEDESIILSYQWDYFISASYYFQMVEGIRNDVKIIDKELLRRSWYYNQMETNFPDIISGQTDNIKEFKKALLPFERGNNYNSVLLEQYYQAIMTGLVENNIEGHNFYLGAELYQNEMRTSQFRLPAGYQIVPHLFLFKIVKGNLYVPAPDPDFVFRRPVHENKYTEFINSSVYNMLTMRALYELSFNKIEQTKKYVNKLKILFPDKPLNKNLNAF